MNEFGLPGDAIINYIYPNNKHVFWTIMIVIYPYITGAMAGAFVVSALSHVFKVKEFEPIGRLALIAALCFGMFAGSPLLFHLGQPQRAFEIFFTPHLTSAMSIFGYVWSGYVVLLIIEVWLIYREFFIQSYHESTGVMKLIWRVLCLDITTYNPESAKVDHKLSVALAGLGIPWAMLLHGYVGFIFGSVKAIAWWATPLQPIIFLLSAIVSGMGILLMMYTFIKWKRGEPYDYHMIKKFMAYLWVFFILDFVLEMLELATVRYEQGHHWEMVKPLLAGPLWETFVLGQVMILSVIPFFLLGYLTLANIKDKTLLYLANLGCFMLAMQVLIMRFNVVIGGQLISKSERGFVDYHFEWLGREGAFVGIMLLSAPFVTYYILSCFIPILDSPEDVVHEHQEAGLGASE